MVDDDIMIHGSPVFPLWQYHHGSGRRLSPNVATLFAQGKFKRENKTMIFVGEVRSEIPCQLRDQEELRQHEADGSEPKWTGLLPWQRPENAGPRWPGTLRAILGTLQSK